MKRKQVMRATSSVTQHLRAVYEYGPKAYEFVRQQFQNLLPSTSTLKQWYAIVDGSPGFTAEAFQAIKSKTANNQTVVVNVVLDEMSIREKREWDGNNFHGLDNLGFGVTTDEAAKSALVFMAVALNGAWKVPLGYFLIKGLGGTERANLLRMCLELLHETGAVCRSITFDGASTNLSMCRELGADFEIYNLQPWIIHPVTQEKVYVFWDACHMIKLVRNTLGSKQIMYDGKGNAIKWEYMAKLNDLQMEEGLHAGNKLTTRHVIFKNEKMKVRLAAQVLSNSVADALIFCKRTKREGFENCDSTATFCSTFNNIFDILNSRHTFSKKPFSQPFNEKHYKFLTENMDHFIQYISEFNDNAGHKIIDTGCKTGFLGLIICLINLKNLYNDLTARKEIDYLLSYKLSQDHIEMFFSALRSRGGFNNNPSALQFQTAYKRLLVRHQVSSSVYGNCSAIDDTTILFISSGKCLKNCSSQEESEIILNDIISESDHDYFSKTLTLTPYLENVITYIAGFVVKKLKENIVCNICQQQIEVFGNDDKNIFDLINIKNRGKLVYPSADVIQICLLLESYVRQYQNVLFTKKNIDQFLTLKVMQDSSQYFCSNEMFQHIQSQNFFNNHRIKIINLIAKIYLKLRLHYAAKQTDKQHRIRSRLNKTILFQNE